LFTIGNIIIPANDIPNTIELQIIILFTHKITRSNINNEIIEIILNLTFSLFFIGLLGCGTGAYNSIKIKTIKNINIVGMVGM